MRGMQRPRTLHCHIYCLLIMRFLSPPHVSLYLSCYMDTQIEGHLTSLVNLGKKVSGMRSVVSRVVAIRKRPEGMVKLVESNLELAQR